ncbi:uncharacterized protein N7484_010537 [Penicillium longicatenatum]|uniref:uncharacterized protein n=1 Tax=Penicillium longicatenatum TaxID=1561947 RepID=UPI0025481D42|nr:uncharacterized protein N7484_010537 [Penicillium longicatenatum]KAJ5630437.1 hypothetical protein N7484_010537 [Penicillium longicatenatum]
MPTLTATSLDSPSSTRRTKLGQWFIIAIAGLDGRVWFVAGQRKSRSDVAPRLPCRTMIYGYNPKVSSHGVETILDYGRELMEEIKKIRNSKELQQRPLFFITHGFGGIILAHAMEEDHPAITSLYRATYGMILFAIPYRGLVMDDIQQMLAGDESHPREQLLLQISSQLDILIHQLADFKNLIRHRKVVSLYQTEQTRRLVFNSESGRWRRTGDYITTVGADSALLQLPDFVEDKIPLHADHSVVVKFDTRNAAGRAISGGGSPCFMVPYKKDPMLMGQKAIISAIKERHKAIGQRHERVALKNPDSHRVFLSCARNYTGHVGFLDPRQQCSAVRTGLPADCHSRGDSEATRSEDEHPPAYISLMVLDNADDDRIFFSGNKSHKRGPLVNFLPQAAHRSILVTSRNGLTARNLVGSDGHIIDVQPINKEESLALLRAKIPAPHFREDIKALVQALEFIPLAITQTGSYITSRSSRVIVSRYLRLFRENESNQTHLLQHKDAQDLRRDPSIQNTQLSFKQIRHDRPAAMDLLALISIFNRQGISEVLVRGDGDGL